MEPITIEQALRIAISHHQAGRWAEAEGIYRQVISLFPYHSDALQLMGSLECDRGNTAEAIDLIGRAIALNPAIAEYHCNLGESFRRAGQWDEAIAGFRRAIELK